MDKALKQRLVGASVLVALAVIVLPMLLGGRPEGESEVRKIELPPQPSELDFETRRYPIGEQPAIRNVSPQVEDSAAESARKQPEADQEPSARLPAGEEASIPRPPASPEPATAGRGSEIPATRSRTGRQSGEPGRYVVQVASFGAIDNANRLSETLDSYGYGVLTDTVESDVGTLHRVRVGPYATEPEARRVATRLRNQVADVRPRVMDLRPDQDAAVTAPDDPLVRWVVQVGSFSNGDNARNLVDSLRAESLSAYREEVTAGGSTIHRVRVGPFLEREEAIRVERQIRERMSLDGVVMSAD